MGFSAILQGQLMKLGQLLMKKGFMLSRLQRRSKIIYSLEIHLLSNQWSDPMFIVVFGWYVTINWNMVYFDFTKSYIANSYPNSCEFANLLLIDAWSHNQGLPSKFCEEHLPKMLLDMVLEDENGTEHEATYIGKRSGLSGGWRAFALYHKLDDGDALVFELIEPARFKVCINKLCSLWKLPYLFIIF